MVNWKQRVIPSSENSLNEDTLLFNAKKDLCEIYGCTYKQLKRPKWVGKEYKITQVSEVVIHENETGEVYWEPKIEYDIKKEILEEFGGVDLDFGYITNDTNTYFYWVEYKIET